VPRNPVVAYFWFGLAAEQNVNQAKAKRDQIQSTLGLQDQSAAQRAMAVCTGASVANRHPGVMKKTGLNGATAAAVFPVVLSAASVFGRALGNQVRLEVSGNLGGSMRKRQRTAALQNLRRQSALRSALAPWNAHGYGKAER